METSGVQWASLQSFLIARWALLLMLLRMFSDVNRTCSQSFVMSGKTGLLGHLHKWCTASLYRMKLFSQTHIKAVTEWVILMCVYIVLLEAVALGQNGQYQRLSWRMNCLSMNISVTCMGMWAFVCSWIFRIRRSITVGSGVNVVWADKTEFFSRYWLEWV